MEDKNNEAVEENTNTQEQIAAELNMMGLDLSEWLGEDQQGGKIAFRGKLMNFREACQDAGRMDLYRLTGVHLLLPYALVCEVDFKDLKFYKCFLHGCTFCDCSFDGAKFYDCSIRGVEFRRCTFDGTHWGNTFVERCDFFRTQFKNCWLGCIHESNRFHDSAIVGCYFTQDNRWVIAHLLRGGFKWWPYQDEFAVGEDGPKEFFREQLDKTTRREQDSFEKKKRLKRMCERWEWFCYHVETQNDLCWADFMEELRMDEEYPEFVRYALYVWHYYMTHGFEDEVTKAHMVNSLGEKADLVGELESLSKSSDYVFSELDEEALEIIINA